MPVSAHQITERHARALLGLDSDKQQKMLDTIVKKGLNVSQTEKAVKQEKLPKEEKKKVMLKGISKNVKIAVNTIHQAVGGQISTFLLIPFHITFFFLLLVAFLALQPSSVKHLSPFLQLYLTSFAACYPSPTVHSA